MEYFAGFESGLNFLPIPTSDLLLLRYASGY